MAVNHWRYLKKCFGWAFSRTLRSAAIIFMVPALATFIVSFVYNWIDAFLMIAVILLLDSLAKAVIVGTGAVLLHLLWGLMRAPFVLRKED